MNLLSNAFVDSRQAGFYGSLKSVYYSLKHTHNPIRILLHSKTTTNISPETKFDIDNRLVVGVGEYSAVSGSAFITTSEASVTQTGDGQAVIGPGSFIKIAGDFSMGNSYINYNSNVRCKEEITIGDGCAISWGFEILDDDSHKLKIGGEGVKSSGPINIRDNVWIGHNSTVQKGVTINENSVVASNSVVTTDVPANTLVAGCPAEIKRENVNWE